MANVLSNNNLKKYISVVYQGEKEKYSLEQVIKETRDEIGRLRNIEVVSMPEKGELKEIKEFTGGAIAFGIGIIFYEFFMGGAAWQPWWLILALLALAVYLIRYGVKGKEENPFSEKHNKYINEIYERQCEEYRKYQAKKKSNEAIIALLNTRIAKTTSILAGVNRSLDRLYGYNVIYPSYRNLIAVSSFYDYLFSGRCDSLAGHEGAYNIFENESRLDKIITRVDRISSQLNNIEHNQHALFLAAKDTTRFMRDMNESFNQSAARLEKVALNQEITNSHLASLDCNTRLIKFNTEQAKNEIEFRNRADGIYSLF